MMNSLKCGLFALACAVAAMGQQQNPVQWTAESSAAVVKPGETFTGKLTGHIDASWHVYSITQPPGGPITTKISVPAGQAATAAGPATGPKPEIAFDESFRMHTETYEHAAEFQVPLTAGTNTGTSTVTINVRYQSCNGRLCLPPKTVHVSVPVTIANGK